MKTTFSAREIETFLRTSEHAIPESIDHLAEGQISQAIGFETVDTQKLVLRISEKNDDFMADKYAYERFGSHLPIPDVIEIGKFNESAYYCISERAPGVNSNKLFGEDFTRALPSINQRIADVFRTEITNSSGYGHLDYASGNGKYPSWRATLEARLTDLPADNLKQNAINIGIDPSLIEAFINQYTSNLDYASEVRRLSHGDLGFDNMLIDGDKVSAIIDWAGIGYAEWMYDYAKFDFWWPGRYMDVLSFGRKYGLETDNIERRKALYWARSALSTIQWADEFKSDHITEWLRTNVNDKLIMI